MDDAAFLSWGWRIPFLLSAALVVLGFWIRTAVEDAPAFIKAKALVDAGDTSRRAPALEALRRHPRKS